jgi:hypothetical protein
MFRSRIALAVLLIVRCGGGRDAHSPIVQRRSRRNDDRPTSATSASIQTSEDSR